MKKSLITLLAVIVSAGCVIVGCKSSQTSTKQGEAAISGFVRDSQTKIGIPGAIINASTLNEAHSATSAADGSFPTLTFAVDSIATLSVNVQKSGYNDTTFTMILQSGSVFQLTINLSPKSLVVPGGGTGLAQTIAFLGATPQEVRVYGVGAQETSVLGWEVRDSLGFPIDAAHSVPLGFTLAGGPTGGEYVSPLTVQTNAVGRAYTTFNSGTRAGVVQIIASTTVGSGATARTITSNPVRMVIDAGFPVQSHFTIAPANYNFPALHWIGRRDPISVLVGDVYSNPVSPGTAVYFHTSPHPVADTNGGAGVIQPAVWTDVDGQGTVNIISGNPPPLGVYADPTFGFGDAYHFVVGRTVGQGGSIVTDSIRIMWSGKAIITPPLPDSSLISPDGQSFHISNNNCRTFNFKVADEYGHPLSAGTVIGVTATVPPPPDPNSSVNQVQLDFGINGAITLDDVILPGPGSTDFKFTLCDGTSNYNVATSVIVRISVSSQNGNPGFTMHGIVY